MSVSITVDITKTVVGPSEYHITFAANSSVDIDPHVFVLSFPDLLFHQVAAPYSMINYPVYSSGSPPPAHTKYVRVRMVILSFPDPSRAIDAMAIVKSDLKTLCRDWDNYNLGFSGNEQFVAGIV